MAQVKVIRTMNRNKQERTKETFKQRWGLTQRNGTSKLVLEHTEKRSALFDEICMSSSSDRKAEWHALLMRKDYLSIEESKDELL